MEGVKMFYVILSIALIHLIYMIYKLRRLKKHDDVLFRFCQIRREAMGILREDGFNLTPGAYKALRKIVKLLNLTIRNYNEYKLSIFNLRTFFRLFKEYKKSATGIERINIPDNPSIKKLYNNLGFAMVSAFLAYTPVLKSELVLRLLVYLLKAITKLGSSYLNCRIKIILDSFPLLKKQSQDFGVPLRLVYHGK